MCKDRTNITNCKESPLKNGSDSLKKKAKVKIISHNFTRKLSEKAEASKLKPITNLFPEMENAQENIEELQTMGIQNKDIRQLLIGKEIYYTGNLYDKDKRKSYQVKNVKIDISKSQNGITTIWLNNIHFKNFLKELWNTLQKTLDNGNWLHR